MIVGYDRLLQLNLFNGKKLHHFLEENGKTDSNDSKNFCVTYLRINNNKYKEQDEDKHKSVVAGTLGFST